MIKIIPQPNFISVIKNKHLLLDTNVFIDAFLNPHPFFDFLSELKKRNRIDVELFVKVPKELKSVVYFSEFKTKDFDDLQKFLLRKFGG